MMTKTDDDKDIRETDDDKYYLDTLSSIAMASQSVICYSIFVNEGKYALKKQVLSLHCNLL